MEDSAALFKALSDPTRLRLSTILAIRGETCVCELAASLDAPEAKISRHLSIMRYAGLVEARRQGTWVHYQLRSKHWQLIACIQGCLQSSFSEHPVVLEDLKRLEEAKCIINKPS